MPAGFTRHSAHGLSNAQLARGDHLPASAFVKHGRINGYVVDFRRSGFMGLVEIQNSVSRYRSATGASWGIDISKSVFTHSHGYHAEQMAVGNVGDARVGIQLTGKQGGYPVAIIIVAARRGKYVFNVEGVGMKNTFGPDQIIRLAARIDRRIKAP
jgi:hypothetical protein